MITVSRIRERLLNLLDPDSPESLDDFDNWFAAASWDMHQSSDLIAQKFAAAIELRLAEFDSGDLSEENLRKELASLVRIYSLHLSSEPVTAISGSSSSFSSQVWAFSAAGRSLVKEAV